MTVKVALGTRVELREVVERHRELRRALAGSARWDVRGLSRSEAAVVRAGWRREVARLRDAGEVLDTVDALAVFGVRREVEVRGWCRVWPEAGEEFAGMGRWPGARDGGYPEAVSFRLPAGLAWQVRAGCWSVSAEAVAALRDWRDRYPGIVRRRPEPGGEVALAEYERLADQIVTVGDVLRAGLRRVLG
ncbi:hypothetical protein RI578_42625 (plasmid) [Streptomyces sp. BB1-1-1]|uniref:hypothetical protein n=1 Tax=Streptomyces sp. BB1-1-1 TaxID=3074430 RepID=UPI0028774E0D|nr:hypothetical protein [Streptomyces sp. BB1-1-1]WND32795.1 hypothetical protein RI578_00005 [Streptomyces sp. BB1-1-1]WND40137.1 hypothetical protein RI578_40400 [Streptomyces sp. BB1-1-1]WND40969.1 hypothetical protein RI578_42625 [Streptomyces sp. BB1-1-1]